MKQTWMRPAVRVTVSTALAFALLSPTVASAQPARAFLRPRQEGQWQTPALKSLPARGKALGKLGNRAITEIAIPGRVGDMGRTVVVDPNDNVWFIIRTEDTIGKIDPKTLQVTHYQLPRAAAPFSFGVDAKGTLWLAAQEGMDMLLEFHPETNTVTAHKPPTRGLLVFVKPDPKSGVVYFNEPAANQIGSYNPANQTFREYKIPTPNSMPAAPDVDAEGNVWFPEILGDKVAQLNPQSGQVKEWELPTKQGCPTVLTVGKSGKIWISLPQADKLLAFRDGAFKEYLVPTANSVVSTSVEDDEGIVWFTEGGWGGSGGGNKFARLDPTTEKFEEFPIPTVNSQPLGLVMDKHGTMWFEEKNAAKVVRVTPALLKSPVKPHE